MRLFYLILLSLSLVRAGGGVLEVDWSSINQSQQKPSAPYPKVLVEGIKEVRLPVYLSASYAYEKNMVVVANRDFYSISVILKGATVVFEGDRSYQESVSPSNREFQKIVQKPNSVEFLNSEGVMSAEFNRHGVNYTILVECDNPKKDKRCVKQKFISNLYHSLKVVGGRP